MSTRPKNKQEFRREMAEAFIHVLEEEGLNWKKNWRGVGGDAPFNGITEACYNGINRFNLALTAMARGYEDPRWVTMVQIMDNKDTYHPGQKWHLKKGSKASWVEYWYQFDLKEKKAVTWKDYKELLKNGRKESEFRLSARYTPVFNASCVEGIPELAHETNPEVEADVLIEKLSVNMGVPIFYDGGDRAYYLPSRDEIHLPKKEYFSSSEAFNGTALHEAAHASGAAGRLDRPINNLFGTDAYAYEELIAEMTSCFLSFHLDTEVTEEHVRNHQAYVQSWISGLREKPEILANAIKDAQQAASYMEWKAELITEAEYLQMEKSAVVTEKQPSVESQEKIASMKVSAGLMREEGKEEDVQTEPESGLKEDIIKTAEEPESVIPPEETGKPRPEIEYDY